MEFLAVGRAKQIGRSGATRTAIAEREAAAAALFIHVFGILAVAGRDDETIFIIGNGHDVIHLFNLYRRQPHGLGDVGFYYALHCLCAHIGAHCQHALQTCRYWFLVPCGQQVGEILHRDAK